jgi:hypothetical protein
LSDRRRAEFFSGSSLLCTAVAPYSKASLLAGFFLNLFQWACKEFPILRAPQFGSIIDLLRHVLNRRLDPQCAIVLMTYFKK